MTGIVVFAAGSLLSGTAPNFWFLVFARFVQGAGMGIIMPLSQAILGDIISPRERGKYMGMMGASFGLASINNDPFHGPQSSLPLYIFQGAGSSSQFDESGVRRHGFGGRPRRGRFSSSSSSMSA